MPFILTLLTPCPGTLPRTRAPRGRSLSFLQKHLLFLTLLKSQSKRTTASDSTPAKKVNLLKLFKPFNKHTFELDKQNHPASPGPCTPRQGHGTIRPTATIPPISHTTTPLLPVLPGNSFQDDVLRLWKLNLQYVVPALFPFPSPLYPTSILLFNKSQTRRIKIGKR